MKINLTNKEWIATFDLLVSELDNSNHFSEKIGKDKFTDIDLIEYFNSLYSDKLNVTRSERGEVTIDVSEDFTLPTIKASSKYIGIVTPMIKSFIKLTRSFANELEEIAQILKPASKEEESAKSNTKKNK